MKAMLRQARIVAPGTENHSHIKDILVENGIIIDISDHSSADFDKEIISDSLHVSCGWVDLFAHIPDPGHEFRETIQSGAESAAAGGFTDVFISPNTQPAVSTKAQVDYIIQQSVPLPVNLYPIGAVSKHTQGKELAEMYDMYASGARCFSDGFNSVQHPNLLIKALQYVKQHEGLIIQIPDDHSLSAHGLVHEGLVSTQMGLPGKPAIAEELMIARDIALLRYTESRLHITGVSTRNGLDLITHAKKEGLDITCSVTPYHLMFTENDLSDYDTNLKVNPPLRSDSDRLALIDGIKNGWIDAITSHHLPLHQDEKDCPFEEAKYGMNTLETTFSMLTHVLGYDDAWINCLTNAPRKIAGLPLPTISVGSTATLTLFDPTISTNYEKTNIRSKSYNTPFVNKSIPGKVLGIINKKRLFER
jgi:dihydroorotase